MSQNSSDTGSDEDLESNSKQSELAEKLAQIHWFPRNSLWAQKFLSGAIKTHVLPAPNIRTLEAPTDPPETAMEPWLTRDLERLEATPEYNMTSERLRPLDLEDGQAGAALAKLYMSRFKTYDGRSSTELMFEFKKTIKTALSTPYSVEATDAGEHLAEEEKKETVTTVQSADKNES
jgi:hypothetical protein